MVTPSADHRTTLLSYIFATKARIDNRKNWLNSNIFPTCLYNMVNFGLLAAETVSLVWGTRANFNGFRVLTSLQRRCSSEAATKLHDVWRLLGCLHYVYIFGALAPRRNFATCKIHFTSKSCVLLYWQRYTARHSSSGRQPNFAAWYKELSQRSGRHLYSAGAVITLGNGPHSSWLYFTQVG